MLTPVTRAKKILKPRIAEIIQSPKSKIQNLNMTNKNSFEESLTTLEKIVRELEQGDLSLEDSLKLFENGVKLSRECQERLNQAERRIEVLLKDENGNPTLQAVEKEDLRQESSPKIKRRIVFDEDDEDETPF